jgi:predicted transposase YdaD
MDQQAEKIGEAAGALWSALEGRTEGLSIAQLKTKTGLGVELLNQAVGWLAREDKVGFRGSGKTLKLILK